MLTDWVLVFVYKGRASKCDIILDFIIMQLESDPFFSLFSPSI